MNDTSTISVRDPRDITLGGCVLTSTGIVFDGRPSFEEWEAAGAFLQRCEGALQFWIGDWLLHGDQRPDWGDRVDQAVSMFGRDKDTLTQYKLVAATFPPTERSAALQWSHHLAVASLPPANRVELLEEAAREALPVSAVRKRVRQERARIKAPPAEPSTYSVVLADPPWGFEAADSADHDETGNGKSGSMTLEELQAFPVETVTAPDCLLLVWATQPRLADAIGLIESWGFTYRSGWVWNRGRSGAGSYAKICVEHLLLGTKGSPPLPARDTLAENLIEAPRNDRGKKPNEFYSLIESLWLDAARLELFTGESRPGWNLWPGAAAKELSTQS